LKPSNDHQYSSQTLKFLGKNIELSIENRQCFICDCSSLVASGGIVTSEVTSPELAACQNSVYVSTLKGSNI
jgi:hypothetical protein